MKELAGRVEGRWPEALSTNLGGSAVEVSKVAAGGPLLLASDTGEDVV